MRKEKTAAFLRKTVLFMLILCMGTAVLTGCGSKEKAVDSAEVADSAEADLQEYQVEGVGIFYLPEGFTTDSGKLEEPLPMAYAELSNGSVTVYACRFGTDAYEAAGVPVPADLKEYSQRDGVKQGLPEGTEFAEDAYGSLFVEYTADGSYIYNVLKKGADSYGNVIISCPEGEESAEFALWASKAELE